MEMIVVIILLGLMVGMSVANYNVTLERNNEKVGVENLRLIHATQMLYFAKEGDYWQPSPMVGTTAATGVNASLNINIIENNMNYACESTGVGTYDCFAAALPFSAGRYSYCIRVSDDALDPSAPNPGCSAGTGTAAALFCQTGCPALGNHTDG